MIKDQRTNSLCTASLRFSLHNTGTNQTSYSASGDHTLYVQKKQENDLLSNLKKTFKKQWTQNQKNQQGD